MYPMREGLIKLTYRNSAGLNAGATRAAVA
jgi:hypothetical protein